MPERSSTDLVVPAARDGERGSMLIEVVVGGLLLAMLAVGLFGAFDGSARVSARTKERATAASLAQRDQERLRGLPVTRISNLRDSAATVVDGVTYTVATRTDWVADKSGNTTCAAGDAAADYLFARSTVTANKSGAAKPVTLETIITPPVGSFGPGQGSLAVELLDRDEKGVADLPVSISGPAADSDPTNQDGCAFFGYQPAGDYSVSFSRAGYVDWNGVTNVVANDASISGGQVSTKSFRYDSAGTATFTFDGSDGTPASYDAVRLSHSKVTRSYDPGAAATSVTMPGLFPFTDAYGAYAGECDANDPVKYGNPVVPALVPRGGNVDVKVRLPTVNLSVRENGSSTYLSGHRVRLTSPCNASDKREFSTDAGGWVRAPLPYGTWGICVDSSEQSLDPNRWRQATATATNTAPGGTPTLTIDLVVATTGGSAAARCA